MAVIRGTVKSRRYFARNSPNCHLAIVSISMVAMSNFTEGLHPAVSCQMRDIGGQAGFREITSNPA